MSNRSECPACALPVSQVWPFLSDTVSSARLKCDSYSSRKMPEFMSYQLSRCPSCGLVFAPNTPSEGDVLKCYEKSVFVSTNESLHASLTYQALLSKVLSGLDPKSLILDVGASDGSFLKRLLDSGFSNVAGIEPSSGAIAAASPRVRGLLSHGDYAAFMPLFRGASLITSFMTLEHFSHPFEALRSFRESLQEGGTLFLVVHNRNSLVNRILGRRSPIIDIEHLQIFTPSSVEAMLRRAGFERIKVRAFSNVYPLSYWLKISPLPLLAKVLILRILRLAGLHRFLISLPVGNLCVEAIK